jgi:bla regulator protein BlaR1
MSGFIPIFKEVIYLGATASILILIILLAKKIFKRVLSPKWHYSIWILLFIRLIVPFSPESSISIYSLLNAAAGNVNLQVGEISIRNPADTIVNSPRVVENTEDQKDGSFDGLSSNGTISIVKEEPKYNFAVIIAASIWAIGVLLFSIYTLCLNIAFAANVRRRYTSLEDKGINKLLNDCKKVMKIKREIHLLTTEKTRAPALYGFINIRILVSKGYMERLSEAEIKYIFLHELSHYKRKDILINWVLTILQIIYFFNPLIWYAFKKVHEDCEIACDAEALRYINEEEYYGYGSTIIKLIKLYSESNFIPITAGFGKNKSSYKRRILMINRFRKSKWINNVAAVVLVASVGLTGLTGCKISKDNESNDKTVITSNSPSITNGGDKTQNNATTEKQTEGTITEEKEDKEDKEDKEVFYGEWVIKKVLAYGSVGTYSKEDAEGLIGKSLSFSKDKANFFGDQASYVNEAANNPIYKKNTLSKEDFVTNYQMTLDKLGVTGDSITEVAVSDSKGLVSTFFVKDENTLIIVGGGTYFELVRK